MYKLDSVKLSAAGQSLRNFYPICNLQLATNTKKNKDKNSALETLPAYLPREVCSEANGPGPMFCTSCFSTLSTATSFESSFSHRRWTQLVLALASNGDRKGEHYDVFIHADCFSCQSTEWSFQRKKVTKKNWIKSKSQLMANKCKCFIHNTSSRRGGEEGWKAYQKSTRNGKGDLKMRWQKECPFQP